ncbi:MAG TPA: hypothetical protein DHW71_06905 [Gammaproteobacteria bacterium]|nr:hypothetical protein [Gammaproteobacteria bacterium]HBF08003.1 hypothetical protein [Gammaproteobacteria bacterium]HCK92695.1 hypothetical protein [Gammaproteobacteria bacterium]
MITNDSVDDDQKNTTIHINTSRATKKRFSTLARKNNQKLKDWILEAMEEKAECIKKSRSSISSLQYK